MNGEPHILDLWFPIEFKGKGRPLFRTIPRSSDVLYHEHDVVDADTGEAKPAKFYRTRDLRPQAYGESTTKFQDAVRLSAARQIAEDEAFKILDGPVKVDWCAYYQPVMSDPAYLQRRKIQGLEGFVKKPDRDNIEKLLLDAITDLAFKDDVQVMFGTCAKIYSSREGLRAQVSACDPMEARRWADSVFKWPEEEFSLKG